jgi:hypothetical protein
MLTPGIITKSSLLNWCSTCAWTSGSTSAAWVYLHGILIT